MTAPNLLNTTTVTGKTAYAALTTITANVITVSTSTVDKLNSVVLSNYSTGSVTANVMVNRSSSPYYIGGNIAIPANSTLVLLGKDTSLYLEEGDVLQANVSVNNSVSITASYELMS